MSECPKCGVEMSMFHEPDGSKDCLRNQLTTLTTKLAAAEQERDALEARVKELETRYENCIRAMWMGTPEGRSELIRDYEDNFQATPQD